MKIYKTKSGIIIQAEDSFYIVKSGWDEFVDREDLREYLQRVLPEAERIEGGEALIRQEVLPPVGSQEIWASGVTYYRSREARMDEAREYGGSDFYDRVYLADRPELFFKASPHRVAGPGQPVRIRRDSGWNVPEPECTLLISSGGTIIGYTIGNDMSSREIEGENPLYLPQAKTYDGSAAIGPCIYVPEDPLPEDTMIEMVILRSGEEEFRDSVSLSQMKRKPEELAEYLYRECSFPGGCLLMTGTGIIPPDDFTLQSGDEIRITIDDIGTLVNIVEQRQPTSAD